MPTFLSITSPPPGLDPELANVLTGLTVVFRPELNPYFDDPTIGTDRNFVFIGNTDIAEAIAVLGIESQQIQSHLSHFRSGRATRIPRRCCQEIHSPDNLPTETASEGNPFNSISLRSQA